MFEKPTSERAPLSSLLFTTLIAAASVMGATLLGARPLDLHEAAGVFPPWWDREASLLAASDAGAVLAVGTLPFIVIVRTPDADAPARLRAAGALFSIDPGRVAPCAA
ncbi:hypothetical protein [Phenylobacterium sp.]|uniref:hypothetical protein n=1 Tax=Phenylobacterium sp. TaxID=1871053 RepID=UPI002716359E|nr:hypothetical protein [Phenylobacterium sp.]MDO8377573.1 hypothetical protein [Phenylobacterium sp.]